MANITDQRVSHARTSGSVFSPGLNIGMLCIGIFVIVIFSFVCSVQIVYADDTLPPKEPSTTEIITTSSDGAQSGEGSDETAASEPATESTNEDSSVGSLLSGEDSASDQNSIETNDSAQASDITVGGEEDGSAGCTSNDNVCITDDTSVTDDETPIAEDTSVEGVNETTTIDIGEIDTEDDEITTVESDSTSQFVDLLLMDSDTEPMKTVDGTEIMESVDTSTDNDLGLDNTPTGSENDPNLDPYFTRGDTTYYFYFYDGAYSACQDSPDPDHCTDSPTPIQTALDDVKTNGMPTDGVIYLEEGDFEESFVIEGFTSSLTLKSLQASDSTKAETSLLGDILIKDTTAAIVLDTFDFLGLISIQNAPNVSLIGTAGADLIKVQLLGYQTIGVAVNGGEGSDQYAISMEGTGGTQTVTINDTGVNDVGENEIDQVTVSGTGGDDNFSVSATSSVVGGVINIAASIQSGGQIVTSSTLEKWLLDGIEGDDSVRASSTSGDALISFYITDRNTGHLTGPDTTFSASFTNIENLIGSDDDEIFYVDEFGTLSGKISGGGGTDILAGPSPAEPGMGYIWMVTGDNSGELIDAESGLTMVAFEQIEQLQGGADNTDSFYVTVDGKMSSIDGGSGGEDSLRIDRDGKDGIIVTGSGTIATNDGTGRSFSYAGMDDIVTGDASDKTLHGTNLDDVINLLFEAHHLVVEFVGYLFQESGGVLAATLSYLLPSTLLEVRLKAGDDELTFETLGPLFGADITTDGGIGGDTLIGPDTANEWTLNGPGEGLLNDILSFSEFETLGGGTAGDHLTGPPYEQPTENPPSADLNTYLWVISAEYGGELYNSSTGEVYITFTGMEWLTGLDGNSDTFIIEPEGVVDQIDGNGDAEAVGGFDYLMIALVDTPDIFVIPDSSGSGTVTASDGRTIAYTGLDDLVKQTQAVVTINGTNSADTIEIADYIGDGNEEGQSGYHFMQMTMAGRQFLFNGVLSEFYVFAIPTESLIVKGLRGADTIIVHSLDPAFGTLDPNADTMLGIYGNEDGSPELFPDFLANDEVIFAGNIYTNGAYLEVFAQTIRVADGVTIDVGDNDIVFRARDIGTAELENLSPVMVMKKEVSIEIGANAVLQAGGGIYLIAQAEDRSFASMVGASQLVDQFLIQPLADKIGSILALPVKVLFKESESTILIKSGARLLATETVGIYSTASADASGTAQGNLFSIGYAQAQATSTVTIESDVTITSTDAAVLVTSSAEATAKMTTETKRELSNVLNPDSKQFAISLAITYANVVSHISVADGVVITAGKTANVKSDGKVSTETEAKSGLFSDGTAGLAFAIEISDADITTDFDGTLIAQMMPGSVVKIEIDPTVTDPSQIGYVDYELDMIHVGPVALLTEDTITYSSRWGIPIGTWDGGLLNGKDYVVIALEDDPETEDRDESEWIQLAYTEKDAIAGNAIDLKPVAGFSTTVNTLDFDGEDIDAAEDTITLDFGVIVYPFELGQAVGYHQNGQTAIPGLVDGGVYYVITPITPFDLIGDTRFRTSQTIQLAESEDKARAGVAIDIGSASGAGYDLRAFHVLDSGFTTGAGVLATLDAESKVSSTAGLESENDPTSRPGQFLEAYQKVTGFNAFDTLLGKLTAKYKQANTETQSGGSRLALAGALSFSYIDHDVVTTIGSEAMIKSNDDLEITASITQKVTYSAESSFAPQTDSNDESTGSSAATSITLAISIGIIQNTAQAIVNNGAKLDALRVTRVLSEVRYPFLTEIDEYVPTSIPELVGVLRTEGFEFVNNYLDGTLGIKSKLFNTWTRSTGQADKVSISGSINFLDFINVAESIVHAGVLINQDTAWRSNDQDINPDSWNHPNQTGEQTVSVVASVYMQMFNMTGIFDLQLPSASLDPLNPEAEGGAASVGSSGKRGGFGGAFFLSFINNTVRAVIESSPTNQTKIYSGPDGGFNIKADEMFFIIDLGQAGANSSKIGVAGTILYNQHYSTVLAQLSSDALVTGRSLKIYAASLGTLATYAGGLVKGESMGVGIAVAINNIQRSVKALIGAENILESTGGPRTSNNIDLSGPLDVKAEVSGFLFTFTLAAAVMSTSPDTTPLPANAPPKALSILGADTQTPPTRNGAGAASISVNVVMDTVQASIVDAGHIRAASVSVSAKNNMIYASATGGAAVVKGASSKPSTALAGAFSLNYLDNSTRAFILDTAVQTLTGDLQVEAARKGMMISISAGVAVTTAQKGKSVAGSLSVNVLYDQTEAYLWNVNNATIAGSLYVKASDTTLIVAIGGGIAYGGEAGVGLGFGLNLLGSDLKPTVTRAYIKNSVIEMDDGTLEVSVLNENPAGDEMRIIAVGGGLGLSSPAQGKVSIGAYLAINIIVHVNEAYIKNTTITEQVNGVDSSTYPLNTLVRAEDSSGIVAVILGVGANGQDITVGAAIGYNEIDNDILAYLDSVSLTSNGTLTIAATSAASIGTAAVGVGASTGGGKLTGAGSIAINTITNVIDAHIVGAGTISTGGTINLSASDTSLIVSIAGGVSVASKGTALGAAVSYNLISNQVKAYIEGTTVKANGGTSDILLAATSGNILVAIAVGGAVTGGDFAFGGSLTVNSIANSLDAHIANSPLVQAGKDVKLVASESDVMVVVAGGFSASTHGSAVGAALAYNYIGGSLDPANPDLVNEDPTAFDQITAYIHNSTVKAGGDIIISAGVKPADALAPETINLLDDSEDNTVTLPEEAQSQLVSITMGAALGNSYALGGSVSINVIAHDINAHISASTVEADGSILVAAADDLLAVSIAGGLAIGQNGVGAGIAMQITKNSVIAYIGDEAVVDARGNGAGVLAPIGTKSGGVPQATLVHGLAVSATSFETIISIAAGLAASVGGSGGAGSVSLNILNETTKAYIGKNAQINMGTTNESSSQSVWVIASDDTKIIGVGAALSLSTSGSVGAGVDVGVLIKDTEASIGSSTDVEAKQDVWVIAISNEDITSVSAAGSGGIDAGLAGSAGVYVLNITTQAFVEGADLPADGAVIIANGNVLIIAHDTTELDIIGGNIAASGTTGVGGSADVAVVLKDTHAFIGKNAKVTGLGQGAAAVTVQTGFSSSVGTDSGSSDLPVLSEGGGSVVDQIGNSGLEVEAPGDYGEVDMGQEEENTVTSPLLTGQREATGVTEDLRGVAVVATSSDDLEIMAFSFAGSGTTAINITGGVLVLIVNTTAHIDENAKINEINTGAHADQNVRVAAASDIYNMTIIGGASVSGTTSVSPAAGVIVILNTTKAYADDGVLINAANDISITAAAEEDVLVIVATIAGSGTVSVGGSVSVIVIDNTTLAYLGDNATSYTTGAVAAAGGDILVAASDETTTFVVAGSLGIGFGAGGAGVGVGVQVILKDTQAYIGSYAQVNAKGNGATGLSNILSGDSTGKDNPVLFVTGPDFHGLAVQAYTSEDVFQVAAAGGGGLYFGLGGGVTVEVINSDTTAYIGNYAKVNQANDGTESEDQSVNVSAANDAKVFAFAGGIAGGAVGVAGGVDVGVIRNDTLAYIDAGAKVKARSNVEVNALSNKEIFSIAVSGAGGLVGAAGSVSVWVVGTGFDSNYSTEEGSESAYDTGSFNSSLEGASGRTGKFTILLGNYGDSSYGNRMSGAGDTLGDNAPDLEGEDGVSGALGVGTSGTTAYIGSSAEVDVGGSVSVRAKERIDYDVIVGSAAGGAVGIGASIAVGIIRSDANAYIGSNAKIWAGSNVEVEANLVDSNTNGLAFSGLAGLAALGAQVVYITDSSRQNAHIDSGAQILQAGLVKVIALADRTMSVKAVGVNVGYYAAAGAAVALGTLSGETKASASGTIGQDTSPVSGLEIRAANMGSIYSESISVYASAGVSAGATVARSTYKPTVEAAIKSGSVTSSGEVKVDASSNGDVEAFSPGGSGGSIAIAAMFAEALTQGATLAYVGSGVNISAGSLTVKASETSTLYAHIVVVSVGLGAGGGGKANAEKTTSVKAYIGTNVVIDDTGAIDVEATSTDTVTSDARGGSGGAISVAYMQAYATIGGQTQAYVDQGTSIDADSLTVKATAAKRDLTATTLVVSVAIGAVGGAETRSEVLSYSEDNINYASVDAFIGPHKGPAGEAAYSNIPVTLDIGGAILVQATTVANATTDATVGAGGGVAVAALYGYAIIGGDTRAYLGQYVQVTNATLLTVKAESTNRASVETEVAAGGLGVGAGTKAVGTVSDNIYAYIAANTNLNITSTESTEGNIEIEAWSKRAEAKATANSYGGGGVAVGAANAVATSTPSAYAYIGSNATVNASGDVSVTAKADSVPATTTTLTDQIEAVNTTTDQVTFTSHGLNTGATVVYVRGIGNIGSLCLEGVTCSLPYTGYVTSDRTFPVVVLDENTLVFGVQFDGAYKDSSDPFQRVNGVDTYRDVIHFAFQHNLVDGDPVKYSVVDGTALSGVSTTSTYYVQVIDEFSIRLFTTRAAALAAAKTFTVSGVSGNTITIDGHGYTNGTPVTYSAPDPLAFSNAGVNYQLNGDNTIKYNVDETTGDITYLNDANNRIFLGLDSNGDNKPDTGHGLVSGQKINFKTDGAISGLSNNTEYYIIKINDYEIQLAQSYCDAVGYIEGENNCYTTETVTDEDGNETTNIIPDPVIAITLTTPAKDTDGLKLHNLIVPAPIGGLADGYRYYIANKTDKTFQLANSSGTVITLNTTHIGSTHSIRLASVNLTASSGGTQQLRIDIKSWNSAPSDKLYAYQQAMEDDDGNVTYEYVSLRSISIPPGDGVTFAKAQGGVGGLVGISVPTATANITHTAKAYIASSVTVGGDVTISSISIVRAKAYAKNGAGGVIMVGEADATTNVTNYTKSFFGTDTNSFTNYNHDATDLDIRAGGTFTVSSEFRLEYDDVDCITHGGGFLAFADADAYANITNHTVSVIGSGADIEAGAVSLSAKVSKLNADAYAESKAGGFTGTSRADAYVQINNWNVMVWIRGGTNTANTLINAARGMDVIASLSNFTLDGHKYSVFYGLSVGTGGSGEPDRNTMKSTVIAADDTTITAGPRVNASTPLTVDTDLPTLALFVQGVNITWDADVIILSGPAPSLWVDANGVIQVKTDNITVKQNGVVKHVGDTITGAFVVEDIVNKYHGQVRFQSFNASGSASSVGTIKSSASESNAPMFEFRDTFNRVSLINDSPYDMTVNGIDVVFNPNLSGAVPPKMEIQVIDGAEATGSPLFRFNLLRSFLPSIVTIQNTHASAGPEIYFETNKLINNPIGTTDILNQSGDILSNGGTQTIRTNILTINAIAGSIGSTTHAVGVELVQSPNRPTSLTATAGLDVYLKIKGLLRENVASFTGNLDLISAGQHVNVQLMDAIKQASGGLTTGLYVVVQSPGDTTGTNTYYLYFRPDRTPTADELVYSLGVTGTGGQAVDSTYMLDLAEASGTGNIKFWETATELSSAPRVNLVGTTDILGTGYIDVDVDGLIDLTEKAGDMRVGLIRSWDNHVNLTTLSGSIIDALADADSDVIGINLTMTSSHGIGSAANYLEIDSSNPRSGLVKATASQSIYMIETAGNLNLDTVTSTSADVSLVTLSGSILDGRNDADYNIQAINIDLDANGGTIGEDANPLDDDDANNLDIDSSNPTTGRLYAEASNSIFLEEISGALNVLMVESFGGMVRLTVRESSLQGEDLNLLSEGTKQVAEGSAVAVSKGRIAASTTVLLQVGDNITTVANSEIIAGHTIKIYGDYGNADTGGTTITLRGDIAANYPSGGTSYWAYVYGNSEADTIQFGDTSGSYIKLGSKTRAYGAGGDDTFKVYYLQTMAVASGHTLTLDGQTGVDTYSVYTTGSQGNYRNYVINVLDTGSAADGTDNLHIYGTDASNDIFLLRKVTTIATEEAAEPAFVALLHGILGTYLDTVQNNESSTDVQRIHYDTGLDALYVYGQGGNDYFASDDTSSPATLNGDTGNDRFQIGQLFGLKRDVIEGNLAINDVFPELIATTRGWLSPGISAPMTVNGGAGNDQFTVYSNKAALQMNGNDGNDLFELRAFALAVVVDTDANGDGKLDANDIDYPTIDKNGDGEINAADAHTTDAWIDDTIVFDTIGSDTVARPLMSQDGSEVQYNMNAVVSIDGGNDFDKTSLIATEFPDDIVITATGVYGMGIQASHINLEVVEVDGMEGDDEFFVLSTKSGVSTRVIGNLGSDTFNVTGDVVEDIATDGTITFPVQPHLLTTLAGPLAIEGGILAGADRSLKTAVKLPGETDDELFEIATQPEENKQIDALNIFDDSNTTGGTGSLTATNLSGFDMAGDLSFASAAFGEQTSFLGGISFGTISIDGSGNYNTNATFSTIEVLNILLGLGADTLNISGTLNPGPDVDTGITADHGGLTIIHGGGGNDNITVSGGGGPNSPLVVYGDTSQAGIWYSGDASVISSYDFGAKPFDQVGTEDDTFIFPLANSFDYHGNDVIDARQLFAGVDVLPSVGFTAYGGRGDDVIWGSQAGDHLAGGMGDDEIHGQGGPDHIYGDSGVNVDILTRALTIPTTNTSSFVDADLLIAGMDTLSGDEGNDIIFGDHGIVFQDVADPNLPDPRPQKIQTTSRLLRVQTDQPNNGANDVIFGNAGQDLIFGGAGDDVIDAGTGNDLAFGDQGQLACNNNTPCDLNNLPHTCDSDFSYTSLLAGPSGSGNDLMYGRAGDDILLGQEGSDTIYGGSGDDDIIGGHNVAGGLDAGDRLDGGSGNDVIVGDNAFICRRTDGLSPCIQVLSGSVIYGDSLNGNPDGQALVTGDMQIYPGGVVTRNVTLFDHAFDTLPGLYGNDYIAGGADIDFIFGQLGDDIIQGDGTIGPVVPTEAMNFQLSDGSTLVVDAPTAYGASRTAASCSGTPGVDLLCDYTGDLLVNPSFEAITDGNDYIEGNGGDDVIFGNLGQDDILGGSSDFFGLTDRNLRPDSSDLIFGGAGTDIARNDMGDLATSGHVRDADAIIGDNGHIYRLVGTNGVSTGNFLTFGYDNYDATLKLIPRAIDFLDYTIGGPDYNAAGAATDIGAADEIHGESGDDFIYGMLGDDVLYGEGQDDDLIGGYGYDWISGGTGDDGILGDDGRIYTSRNGTAEPLYGIGDLAGLLDQYIYTPGKIQEAIINVSGQLKKTFNLVPFNLDPNLSGQDPLFNARYADDILYGGLGNDALHGGSGDDAISGAEALPESYAQLYDSDNVLIGLSISDYFHPYNPGDVLRFNPDDPDGWHYDRTRRAGEFALYDEYNPLQKILLADNGTATTGVGKEFFLNFVSNEGPLLDGCIALSTSGKTCLATALKNSDGNDVLFGDLGNDWIIGGTGQDDLYGGYGNDLLNADDDLGTNGGLNDMPDTHPTYEDRAYGGAGRDVLIANTGGDRLIDWVGEFNSYLVPFAPFGMATVSRTLQPQLMEFLYALSASDGADPTRAADAGANPLRNGEPEGELGLVLQKDFDWHDQTGAPADPQAGNIPGGKRDVLRTAGADKVSIQNFSIESGPLLISGGRLEVTPSTLGGEVVSVFFVGEYLPPNCAESQVTIDAAQPTGGLESNVSFNEVQVGRLDENVVLEEVQQPSKPNRK